jgi:hypothetical protein
MDHQSFAQLLGNYGEFLGATAVFVTLIYLATQVRHTSEQTRLALSQARTEANRALVSLGLEDKILEAHVKADMVFSPTTSGPLDLLMSQAELSREEATRVLMVFVAYWNYVVQIAPVAQSLGESEKQLFNAFIGTRFRSPGTYGEIYQHWIKPLNQTPEVIAYVDAILSEH